MAIVMLKLYGPQAMDSRRALRDSVADAVRQTWPTERTGSVQLNPNEQMGDAVYVAVQRLSPQDDAQRELKTQATNLMVQLAELRARCSAGGSPLSEPLADRSCVVASGYLFWLQSSCTG